MLKFPRHLTRGWEQVILTATALCHTKNDKSLPTRQGFCNGYQADGEESKSCRQNFLLSLEIRDAQTNHNHSLCH